MSKAIEKYENETWKLTMRGTSQYWNKLVSETKIVIYVYMCNYCNANVLIIYIFDLLQR